jgi:hypothetical protein
MRQTVRIMLVQDPRVQETTMQQSVIDREKVKLEGDFVIPHLLQHLRSAVLPEANRSHVSPLPQWPPVHCR